MAFPTAANHQDTDAVTQASVKVLGAAPAMAMGTIDRAAAHSIGTPFENAVGAQRQHANRRLEAVSAPTVGVVQRGAREMIDDNSLNAQIAATIAQINVARERTGARPDHRDGLSDDRIGCRARPAERGRASATPCAMH